MQTLMSAAALLGAGAAVDLAVARVTAHIVAWRARREAMRHDPVVIERAAAMFAADVRRRIAAAGYTIEVTHDRWGRPMYYHAVPMVAPTSRRVTTSQLAIPAPAVARRPRRKPMAFATLDVGRAI